MFKWLEEPCSSLDARRLAAGRSDLLEGFEEDFLEVLKEMEERRLSGGTGSSYLTGSITPFARRNPFGNRFDRRGGGRFGG